VCGARSEWVGEHTMSWRVKLYQLNDVGEWDDKGTGHITCAYSEVRAGPPRHSSQPICVAQTALS
jgi:hypothetical protein